MGAKALESLKKLGFQRDRPVAGAGTAAQYFAQPKGASRQATQTRLTAPPFVASRPLQ